MYRLTLAVVSLALLTACGGGGGSFSTTPPSGGGGGGGSQVGQPTTVTVSVGQTTTGVDINVPAPAANPAPNAQVLGVAASLSGASAFNTGATIRRGTTMQVLLFGPGLSGSMQVKISGPSDVTVSNIITIKATDDTPGVAFTATVSGSAALGARTVLLINSQNDVTTFTGGLEVIP